LLALCQALKASDLQLANIQGLKPVQLDKCNLAALRRLQERATTTGRDLAPLLLTGGIKEWEDFICCPAAIQAITCTLGLHGITQPVMRSMTA
jgi:hypothetical protein